MQNPDLDPGASVPSDPRAAGVVYFDGGCPLCRREIGVYRELKGADAVEWRDISDGPVPDGFDREALLGRFTVRRRDGNHADGAAGFVALWRALAPTRVAGRILDRQPFLAIGEVLYRLFLKLRPLWRSRVAR